MTVDERWIEAALAPAAAGARLRAVTERRRAAFNSDVRHLELRWEGAPPGAPVAVVWKQGPRDDREVAVWRLLRSRGGLPVPRCFAADARGLLLEDLSATHAPPVARDDLLAGRGLPAGDQAGRVVDSLADLHAAWWEDPALGQGVAQVRDWFRDGECHERHVARRRDELDRFLAAEPASPHRETYREALAVLERLWTPEWAERLAARRAITLVQGDAYLNQFLLPREGEGPAVVLDFGDATANPGAWDLAFLMTTFWTPAQRASHEGALLSRYRERLAARGVALPERALLDDYRRMVAYLVFDPVWNCTAGSARAYWEPKMCCLVAAWRDLDCASLNPPS